MRKLVVITALLLLALSVNAYAQGQGNAYGHDKHGDFTIGIGSELGSATFVPNSQDWVPDSYVVEGKTYYTFSYALPAPVVYYAAGYEGDPAYEIGAIESLTVDLDQDPAIGITFGCRGGALATTFSFSNYLDFATLLNAQAQATASNTATDRNANGATLTGLFAGGTKTYQARYNTGTLFANLVNQVAVDPNQSGTGNESTGASFTSLFTSVNRMEAQYNFTITARDGASGTSNFQIIGEPVPEPSSLLALAAGALPVLGFARRRRHS